MKATLIVTLALFAVAVSANMSAYMGAVERVRGGDNEWAGFVDFVAKYGREYTSVREINAKFDIFKDNMATARAQAKRNPTARFGATKFSDMSHEEFVATMLMSKEQSARYTAEGKRLRALAKPTHHHHKRVNTTAGDVDWCKNGICTAVKDQGQCGSCWAFSATETLESVWIQQGKGTADNTILGPQQIVDCDQGGGDQGCNGGMPSSAIQYLANAGGQESEQAYPYEGKDGNCNFDKSQVVATPSGSDPVSGGDQGLQDALQKTVVSVGVDAQNWQNYQGGVFSDCGTQLDHAVVATGFSADQGGYYFVRNSWGANWGENGFIFIAANGDTCGIADNAITVNL
jgi:cathepsin F